MLFENLDDAKEQTPLILDSNYKAMDIIVLEDVERGEPVYINANKEGTKTAAGNKLFGIVLDDMQANGITAILVAGSVNLDEVKHTDPDSLVLDFRDLGIYLKRGIK